MCRKASRSAAPPVLSMLAPARSGGAHASPSSAAPARPPPARRRRGLVRALARQGADDGVRPAPASFVDVRSDELGHVMRTCATSARPRLVVEFYAGWCNSCRRCTRLCKLAAQEQDVLFVKIDFDACDLCRALGGTSPVSTCTTEAARLADFSASPTPKFQRLTDAIDANRALGAVNPAASVAVRLWPRRRRQPPNRVGGDERDYERLPGARRLHRVTFVWRGGGEDVMPRATSEGGRTRSP